jgi:ABC-type bacteriocin/lantibiotic exporter with double-glycine peptidase domain
LKTNSKLVKESVLSAAKVFGRKTMAAYWALTSARALTGLLDVIGVVLLSQFSASVLNQNSVSKVNIPFVSNINESPFTMLSLALVCLSLKSFCSYLINLALIKLLIQRCSQIIELGALSISDTEYDLLSQYGSHKLHYLLTAGIRANTYGILYPLSIIVSEGTLLLLFLLFLFATSAVSALLTICILGLSSTILHRFLSGRQYRNGQLAGSAAIRSFARFQDLIHGFKELSVNGNLISSIRTFSSIEVETSKIQTNQTALAVLPRHVLETVVMISLGVIGFISSRFNGVNSTLVLITIFGAATARILPCLIPLQSSMAELQTNLGKSSEISIIKKLGGKTIEQNRIKKNVSISSTHKLSVRFNEVSYRYPLSDIDAVSEMTFDFSGNGWFAIDGPSGSGKSTIFDLLMGVCTPQIGGVFIGGTDPWSFIRANPGFCSYLPQRISVINGSIAENVAFGVSINNIDLVKVTELLDLVGLDSLALRLKKNPTEPIGELAGNVSGGQLQRLGVARCLYSKPSIILFDESTSGLDSSSQKSILDLIEHISKTCMVVSISHDKRISDRASQIVRINSGLLTGIEIK